MPDAIVSKNDRKPARPTGVPGRRRDEDRSLQANLGFMALRCTRAVTDFWTAVGGIIAQKRPGATGDQRIVNRALAEPSFYGTPRLRWGIFPGELATHTLSGALTRDSMRAAARALDGRRGEPSPRARSESPAQVRLQFPELGPVPRQRFRHGK